MFFNIVASDPDVGEDFCRKLLSVLLQKEIVNCKVHAQRTIPGIDPDRRGIRLDVEVVETSRENVNVTASVYDIEPHVGNDSDFPRLLRFRQAKIDSRYMKSGDNDFSHLPNLYVILISDYDPFKMDYMLYTIQNACKEIPNLEYEDGLKYLYFNTKGEKGGSSVIRNVLEYMRNSHDKAVVDSTTEELDRYVQNVRLDPSIRGTYMTFGDKIDREKAKSFSEGDVYGRDSVLAEIVCKKMARGMNLTQIAEDLEIEESAILKIYETAKEHGPDYDSRAVIKELHPETEDA